MSETKGQPNIVKCPACGLLTQLFFPPETAACACGNIMMAEPSPDTTVRRYALPWSAEGASSLVRGVVQEQLETLLERGADEEAQWRFVTQVRKALEEAFALHAAAERSSERAPESVSGERLEAMFVADHRALRWSIAGRLDEIRYRTA
ncbi:hypothetical protein [Lignipirellula cremea]|uniref:Uncharacterized protein n=1 Tax=Lignipirellula cremea TaxID=2528010 RepID=A0A518E3L0_9BACT|nr:hypothetical protein [Lignipirellula cremea]QDU98662.1 hypothetical protein Pla8534_65340 [Lignipirellula cremea]